MSDPADAFHAAIRATPDDDLPRLVFADWLDENGEPERAEYIRLACAISKAPDGVQKTAWSERARILLSLHREEWFGNLPGEFKQLRLDRGFITACKGHPTQIFNQSRTLDLYAPCLSWVGVINTVQDAQVVLGLDLVRRINHLFLEHVAPASLDSLTSHVELPNLSELCVRTNGLDRLSEGVRFTDWCLVRRVASLRLSIGFGGIAGTDPSRILINPAREFLDRHADLANLQSFRLWGIVEPIAHALARWPRLTQLAELNLHHCCVTEEALPILLPQLRNTKLQVLRLGHNALTDSAVLHVADTPLPETLRELRLDRNRIGDRGVEALIASRHLKDELNLHIGNNTFSGRSAARLRERFPNVRF